MKLVVYKYDISLGRTYLNVPEKHKFLKVDMQNGYLVVWVLVDIECSTNTQVKTDVVGTGHIVDFKMPFLDTVFDGPFVWHVFGRFNNNIEGYD